MHQTTRKSQARVPRALAAAGALCCLIVGAVLVPSAASASDNTPPVLHSPREASYVVGGQISADSYRCGDANDPGENFIYIPETFSWWATDGSGDVRYDLRDIYEEGYVLFNSSQTSYTDPTGGINYRQNECGSDVGDNGSWQLTAKDGVGNATTRNVYGHRVGVTQERNLVQSMYPTYGAVIRYSSGWKASTYSGYSGGGTMKSSTAGASATVTVTVPSGSVTHLGLVMSTGPTRGSFRVYVDGTPKATVSTYAAASRDRVIAWERVFKAGTHRVRVVNLATAGHPGVYLDAVLTNS